MPAPSAWKRVELDSHISLVAFGLALAVAAWLRFPFAGSAFLFGDEFHSLRRLDSGYLALASTYGNRGSGMALPLLQRILVDLFGANHWTLRIPALLPGMALVASLFLLGRKWVGDTAALVAMFLAAVSSPLIYYSHFGRAYALMAWLSLFLVHQLQCLIEALEPKTWRYLVCAGLIALLPYVHLTSTALVAAAVAATLVILWREGRRLQAWRLLAVATTGAVVAALLHLPALESFLDFVSVRTERRYFGEFGFWDVAALLAGGRLVAMLGFAALVIAAVRFGREIGARALLLLASAIAPGLAIALIRPYGDAYAWLRYTIAALPFWFLLLGWGIAKLSSRGVGLRGAAAGAVLAFLFWAAGPYGPARVCDGPFANTYLTLFPLPAFDEPWDETPAIYAVVADDPAAPRIIEVPALVNRTRHLYRNYYLQHRADTWLGVLPGELGALPRGPYVDLSDAGWREKAKADYLILHMSIADELRDYWGFVYAEERRGAQVPGTAAYMQRHSDYGKVPQAEQARLLEQRLTRELGEPTYRDARVAAWRLRPNPG